LYVSVWTCIVLFSLVKRLPLERALFLSLLRSGCSALFAVAVPVIYYGMFSAMGAVCVVNSVHCASPSIGSKQSSVQPTPVSVKSSGVKAMLQKTPRVNIMR
jgi:hypothetical protein